MSPKWTGDEKRPTADRRDVLGEIIPRSYRRYLAGSYRGTREGSASPTATCSWA